MINKSKQVSAKKRKEKTIAILTCWDGPYPWYFPYFMHSCSFNPTIDFIIITDNINLISNKPLNVKIIFKKINEIKIIASKKLGFTVNIDCPYKLCDFKPAYGFLFPEIVKGYDFWGHGDIDVVYGNIRNFITNEMLNTYNVISVRHDFLVGYFTLYRNTKKINCLFKISKDYKKVFTSAQHFCFDECNFAFWRMNHDITFEDVADQCEIESMTHVIKKLQQQKKVNAYFDTHAVEGISGKLQWNNGTLIFKRQFEIILYHLIILKKIYSPAKPKHIPNIFSISSSRIYHH